MRCIKISDMSPRGYLAVDITDFIQIMGDSARTSQWLVQVDWATGEGADRLYAISAEGVKIDGYVLVEVLKAVVQVVSGRFDVYKVGTTEPWAIIEAIDGCYFILEADEELLCKARMRFSSVSDYSNEN